MSRFFALVCGLLLIAGCSTIPRQEDVTGEDTSAVVQKLRCEAGQALNDLTIDLLRNPALGATEKTLDFADSIDRRTLRGTALADDQYRKDLSDEQKRIFAAYTLSAVTFDFKFNITESNKNSLGSNAKLPFGIPTNNTFPNLFSLDLDANADFTRLTDKTFQVTNTFFDLHTEYDDRKCDNVVARHFNAIYPITGRVGMEKIIRDYIETDRMRTVIKSEQKYSEILTFTTSYGASAGPTLSLAAFPRNFRLTDLNAVLGASRTDVHQVNVEMVRGQLLPGQTFRQALALARANAADRSLINANFTRTQDLFIIPGRSLNSPVR